METAGEKFLRLPEVESRVGLRKSSIYARIAEGAFPKPINLGAQAVAWRECEVAQWQAKMIEESRKQIAP